MSSCLGEKDVPVEHPARLFAVAGWLESCYAGLYAGTGNHPLGACEVKYGPGAAFWCHVKL
ncbi:hypothetical protein [Paenibacillus sp. sgz500958]|uniref:hypothetical protein n=1 Tax=Paenibacillus sp. sgz500958 TaxID=3242475 RepID=UPI0036D24FA9